MQREYELWAAEVSALTAENDTMNSEVFAAALAHSLEKHKQLLKLLAMNQYDMEEHSRPDRLSEFKAAYGASLDAVRACLDKFFPHIDREMFIYVFFPFLFGVYPYAVASDKQLTAMNEANCKFELHSIYDIIYLCVKQLLGGAI